MKWKYRKISERELSDTNVTNVDSSSDSLMEHHENRSMFNYIAPFYDKTNVILSLGQDRYWRRKAVSRLLTSRVRLVIDIGAGTGDIGLNITRRSPETSVIGIDTSIGMMKVGMEKTHDLGVDHKVMFCSSDVLKICFADNTFDAAITSFCIRNVGDRKGALLEIFRVLKSGARLIIVELTQPQGLFMKPLFKIYSRIVTPTITRLFSSVSAYDYLTESMADFPRPADFSAILEQTGFKNVNFSTLTFGIVTVFEGVKP